MSKERKMVLVATAACTLVAGLYGAAVAAPGPIAEPGGVVASAPAHHGDLMDVRVTSDDDGLPVVTLVGSGELAYDGFMVEDPPRLVLDLYGVVSRVDTYRHSVGSSGVVRVRAGQYTRDPELISRVVFDLEREVPYEIESVGPDLRVSFGRRAGDAPSEPAQEYREPPTAPAEAPAPEIPKPGPTGDPVADVLAAWAQPAEEAVAEAAPAVDAPAPPPPPVPAPAARPEETATREREIAAPRAVPREALEGYLQAPAFAAEEKPMLEEVRPSFETRTIVTEATQYTGKRISLNLVDADIKQVFRLFHEISGLNFVLDPSVEGRVTIVLDNVPWDQALDIILKNNGLDKVLENNVIRIAPTQKLAQEAAERKQLKDAKELEVEPITVTRTLSYAKADAVERVIRDGGILSDRGKVIVDERTNTLIISDIPKKVTPLDQLITTLDTETPQVMIEARIVESSRESVRDLGIEWGFAAKADASTGTSTGLSFPHNASVKYGLNLPGPGDASQLAFSFGNVVDSLTLDIALNALETEGRGRVLSSPKIATQNNERAEIEQGVRIPVVNTTATEIDVQFVSASLRLIVTPQITAEGTVIMEIEVENNTPDFVNRVGDVPPINTQRAATKVLISDGGTTVIGGIFSVNEGQSETGVPWFRKVPLFGWLFKSQNITQQNRELLIFITPKIMTIG